MSNIDKFQAKLNDWIIPALIGLGVYYLQNMSQDIATISRTLAVAVQRLDDHERRLEHLEGTER